MTKPKHPDGMTVGTFTSTEAGNEIEFFICASCLNADHPSCTGFAWDRSYGERHLYNCECTSKADGKGRNMTKREKLYTIIKKDVKSGFVYEMEKRLRTHPPYLVKLNGHPSFMEDVVEMIVQDQLPFYETVSDAGVDAAYEFFMSEAGTEWCMLSAKFVTAINKLTPGWINKVMKGLAELN